MNEGLISAAKQAHFALNKILTSGVIIGGHHRALALVAHKAIEKSLSELGISLPSSYVGLSYPFELDQ